uniref:Uncharacterized protein n=1 Tax=Anguilla anguilla TaxID=7936 RepID=A0A0E9Q9H2_ANGAN
MLLLVQHNNHISRFKSRLLVTFSVEWNFLTVFHAFVNVNFKNFLLAFHFCVHCSFCSGLWS